MRAADVGFPRAARLLKPDEFSSVFRERPWGRSRHFVLYGRRTGQAARLGLVIGRKYASRAVSRNLIKRIAREIFRHQRAECYGWDILLRLHVKLDRKIWRSASSEALKAVCSNELETLFSEAICSRIKRST
ncbi:ribonuclease P protein component [Mycoavidus cysteinexigens]|uniref:ribonuclease P protein component n=1 Tax=Mycoavidus cysteinexigens TaxID=1553431 RepID=UPI000B10779C|nr:ribonuclease P protein component [Mycoavidus cysteinexigens]GAM53138.1 ribonuclease P protein component [bacterium endosymbiont of Mortierella elongata FMR23-6]